MFLVGMLEHMVGNVTQPILLPLHVEKEPSRGTCAFFFTISVSTLAHNFNFKKLKLIVRKQ